MVSWQTYKQEALKDPAVKKAYDALEPAHKLARAFIEGRIAEKLTQTELAKKAGVSREVIARLESGTGNPTMRTIGRVARALGRELKLVEIQP